MAGLKITDLALMTSLDITNSDVIPVVDIETNTTKQLTIGDLKGAVTVIPTFASITNKPTTIGGYGITDTYTIQQMDIILQAYSPNIAVASSTVTGLLSNTDWITFNNKQDALVSGTSIKTINGTSILGVGDIAITGGGASSVKYPFFATEGQTAFVCTGAVLAEPLVFLNGVLQTITQTYTVLNDTVTFIDPRVLNETILVVN